MGIPIGVYEVVPTDILMPWDKNPRKNKHAIEPIKRSIRSFGFAAPLVVQKGTYLVIAGHTRLEAAKELRMAELPCMVMDLDDREAAALALADNKLGEKAVWDMPLLAHVLEGYSLPEIELIGFDDLDLEKLANQVPDFGPVDMGDDDGQERCEACGQKIRGNRKAY